MQLKHCLLPKRGSRDRFLHKNPLGTAHLRILPLNNTRQYKHKDRHWFRSSVDLDAMVARTMIIEMVNSWTSWSKTLNNILFVSILQKQSLVYGEIARICCCFPFLSMQPCKRIANTGCFLDIFLNNFINIPPAKNAQAVSEWGKNKLSHGV